MNAIIENDFVEQITKNFTRSSLQLNKLQQSDAEIIQLPNNSDSKLAITTDSIAEEIAVGLYDDPYLAGWMIVMVNMSDLAAVGAKPLGILISEILPEKLSEYFLMEMQRGINDACSECGTFVLGGDTNSGNNLILTGCAVGILNQNNPNYRTGCRKGDLLYASDFLGSGNAFAISKLLTLHGINYNFRPTAKIKEGQALCGIATTCMDTSDGVISTLDQLMRLNNVGFELYTEWQSYLDPEATQVAEKCGIPTWLLLAGQHGEFELVFTIPASKEECFISLAAQINWKPIKIGKVTEKIEIVMPLHEQLIPIDSAKIRNLSNLANNDVSEYLNALLKLDQDMQKIL